MTCTPGVTDAAGESLKVLRGVDLTISSGQTHAIMGPNGSGKTTLAYAIAGHPKYHVSKGSITLDGEDVLAMSVDAPGQAGPVPGHAVPVEVPGVSVANFLRTAITAVRGEAPRKLRTFTELRAAMDELSMDPAFAQRNLNEGFSGGEKKRHEILQLELLAAEDRHPGRDRLRPGHRRAPGGDGRASTGSARTPRTACCSSPTTPGSCGMCSPTSCTYSSAAGSPRKAARSWPRSWRRRATSDSSREMRRHDRINPGHHHGRRSGTGRGGD